jgi:rfaE bifunctional protein nucleotidyltransferase chain/domain
MNRAILVDVACFTDSRREDRLLDDLAAEYLPLPVVPAAVDWTGLDPGLAIEATASWVVVGPEAACCCEPDLAGRFAGCIAVGGGRLERAAAANGWRCAPDLAAALAAIAAATRASRVTLDREAAATFTRALRAKGRRVAFTNGVFDLFHLGHLRLLAAARATADALVVGVNGDASAARLKGRARPVTPQFHRAAVVAGCRAVDLVAIFDEDTPVELLAALRPDVLVKGGEYRRSQVVGRALVEGWGGRVLTVPHVEGVSTTAVVRRIRAAPRAGAGGAGGGRGRSR